MEKESRYRLSRALLSFISAHRKHIGITAVTLIILFMAYIYFRDCFYLLKDPEKIRDLVKSFGRYGILVFILLQFLQVVIFFIPGELVQIAGGYIYGAFYGTLISLAGITLGSFTVFLIARSYGRPFVEKIISHKDLKYFKRLLHMGKHEVGGENHKDRAIYIIFVLFLIPGIPKDALGYICGITEISFRDYALYSTVGRIPGILISAYFGSNIYKGDLVMPVIIAVVMGVLFFTGVLKGENLIKRMFHRRYGKIGD